MHCSPGTHADLIVPFDQIMTCKLKIHPSTTANAESWTTLSQVIWFFICSCMKLDHWALCAVIYHRRRSALTHKVQEKQSMMGSRKRLCSDLNHCSCWALNFWRSFIFFYRQYHLSSKSKLLRELTQEQKNVNAYSQFYMFFFLFLWLHHLYTNPSSDISTKI